MSLEKTTARPDDTAFNIQHGCPLSRISTGGPHSTSSSPMDDSSPPSEMDYAECVAANNNMDVEEANPSPLLEGWRAAITVGTTDGPLTGLSNR